ncbi:carotenoid biosynthesis protein [Nitratireductor mangrovi]|uniref:Carotenoid biosynthesis protein n=1 Tax=Nitratireductor mangrovi TaxID=2599600 RepID=A0A5B8L2R8_9HYPH|nr:carotenoid biosynthesis protein [Nitratireductor mangrovi]QDZ02133.1 carotenoid biosynthesis protein [Nitratireductor mangrovi]
MIPSLSRSTVCMLLALTAWAGNALYAWGTLDGPLKYWSPAIVAGAMIAYLVIHGRQRYSGAQLLGFAVIVFLVGWFFETLSVLTGFPFGNYHYTELMAPFLGHVPVSVMPAYCVMGYASWSMARILLNRMHGEADAVLRFAAPAVAALLMVVWDLSMDPLRATVEQRWVWLDGGPHFGVPMENYFGWALVTWIMFQAFALFIAPGSPAATRLPAREVRRYWLSVPVIYAAFAVEYVLNPLLFEESGRVAMVEGIELPVGDIYAEVAVLAATSMLPLALLGALFVRRAFSAGEGTGHAASLPVRRGR